MERGSIIIITNFKSFEAWGSVTDICRNHKEFSYNYLKGKKFPFVYKGFLFAKVKYRSKTLKMRTKNKACKEWQRLAEDK